jgi:hypothetical protein
MAFTVLLAVLAGSCTEPARDDDSTMDESATPEAVSRVLGRYVTVPLTADLSGLPDHERAMIPLLIEAVEPMNSAFWMEAYGDPGDMLGGTGDANTKLALEANFGPWDRLDGDAPFLPGIGEKPAGANFYPADMTREEFEAAAEAAPDGGTALRSLYTFVRRDAAGELEAVPYHVAFASEHALAAEKLLAAAALTTEPDVRAYLEALSAALLTDDYRASDLAWMDMKAGGLDVVLGPIETYEDQLFGQKAAHEGYVLVKDLVWSERLGRYATMLPDMQRGIPVPDAYKTETPGSDADLGAYDVVYVAGQANEGAKTIAFNLPNDEEVQLQKGTRRVQMKNVMRAKFDYILSPLADVLIAEDQRSLVTFDAFFDNTMFHEVAHGLGIKNTITGAGTVREALQAHYSPLEEGKADVLGLYFVTRLYDQGEAMDGTLEEHYVTFMASIFRSIRFGASSAHGRANMMRFNFFKERGAFTRDPASGTYRVNIDRMQEAMNDLTELILTVQGDGDHERAGEIFDEMGTIGSELQSDLDRLAELEVPVDLLFEQGPDVLAR